MPSRSWNSVLTKPGHSAITVTPCPAYSLWAQALNEFIGSYSGDGVSGPIAFDENGDITQSKIYAYFVKNGELDVENPQAIS